MSKHVVEVSADCRKRKKFVDTFEEPKTEEVSRENESWIALALTLGFETEDDCDYWGENYEEAILR